DPRICVSGRLMSTHMRGNCFLVTFWPRRNVMLDVLSHAYTELLMHMRGVSDVCVGRLSRQK
ncbi:hypothetical protein PIB30_105403, partial [Stylosanthes scabra]|nr:hypothetical protein [Stylosanthes scabra]